jgi:hypothetical protein
LSKNKLKDLQTSYRLTFGNEGAHDVIADLRAFCFATATTGRGDGATEVSNEQMREREGRRQVFLRIMQMMKVDIEEIYGYVEDYPDDDF